LLDGHELVRGLEILMSTLIQLWRLGAQALVGNSSPLCPHPGYGPVRNIKYFVPSNI